MRWALAPSLRGGIALIDFGLSMSSLKSYIKLYGEIL